MKTLRCGRPRVCAISGPTVPKLSKITSLSKHNHVIGVLKTAPPVKTMTFGSFLKELDDGHVKGITITPGTSRIKYSDNEGQEFVSNVLLSDKIIETAVSNNVDILIYDKDTTFNIPGFLFFAFPIIFFIILVIRSNSNPFPGPPGLGSGNNGFGQMFNNGPRTGYDIQFSNDINVSFDDVAGIDEAKEELVELVEFLKKPKVYSDAGAKIPKGCLLVGQPGTGKTLLAKAIAGEAGVPFISCSASQFIELFVGLGSSRIRGLFQTARENSPCIIFIDEIDAIGKQRGNTMVSGGGNDEREQTLNQLLTEMDGFADNDGVVVLGATNRIDVLDPALLRPGRFDRKVEVSLPDAKGREKILEVYKKGKSFDENIDFESIARRTIGASGADLMNIMNEAAILAVRNKRVVISNDDIDNAYEKVTIGLPRLRIMSDERKRLVAYHEAGHALMGYFCEDFDDVAKVSILPRGGAGGVTYFIPRVDDEQGLYTKQYLKNKLAVALGGHAAEEIIYGVENVTTGATSDFKQATDIARKMVGQFGMSSTIGKFYLEKASQETQDLADTEARAIVDTSYKVAIKTLSQNRDSLDKITELLIDKETITGPDMIQCLKE